MASGLKIWSTNAVPTANDLNDYLSKQRIMRFPTVTARDAAVTVPAPGQMAYTDDYGEVYVYQGSTSSWIGVAPRVVVTSGNQVRNNNTAYAEYTGNGTFPAHSIELEPTSIYQMDICYEYATDAAADIGFTHVYDGSVPGIDDYEPRLLGSYLYYSATSSSDTRLDSNVFCDADWAPGGYGSSQFVPFLGYATIQTITGGNLTFKYRQWNADPTNTTVSFAMWRVLKIQ